MSSRNAPSTEAAEMVPLTSSSSTSNDKAHPASNPYTKFKRAQAYFFGFFGLSFCCFANTTTSSNNNSNSNTTNTTNTTNITNTKKKVTGFHCCFSVSLLLNFLLLPPVLFMTTQVSLLPDGIAVQVSHERMGNLLQSNAAPGIIVSAPQEHQYKQQPLGEEGNLNEFGKSCIVVAGSSWQCQDCGPRTHNHNDDDGQGKQNNNNTKQHASNDKKKKDYKCKPLERARYKCDKPMHRNPWDSPPRVSSSFDPTVVEDVEMRTIHRPQKQWSLYLKQPLCTIESCFDLSKCNSSILTIYTNATTASSSSSGTKWMDYAQNNSSIIRRVHKPDEACLRIVFPDTYDKKEDMYNADHWYPHGRNNLLWDMGNFKMSPWTGDHVFQNFHYEYAAVASQSLNRPTTRIGYDLVLPLVRRWHRLLAPSKVDIHRPRRWLVSFRGDIQHKRIPYYNHRWLASEFWEQADDVYIDVACRKNHKTYNDYDTPGSMYSQIMMNSTFGFCPGGAGVSSYRLGEYLSTGTIPVVVGDMLRPFAPEIDWSGCWIVVSEARIVDLPRILREMSSSEVKRRQTRCWELHKMIWGEQYEGEKGWKDNPGVAFTKGLEVFAARIANTIESKDRMQKIIDPMHKGN